MGIYLIIVSLLFSGPLFAEESTSSDQIGNLIDNSNLENTYPPRTSAFSESKNTADGYTNSQWLSMSMIDRANYIHSVSVSLNNLHGLSFSPRIMTCKALRESCFRPQDKNPNSTAGGLSQVTKSTLVDLFKRGQWFTPMAPESHGITSGAKYYEAMKTSMVVQLEAGLAVLEQKARDSGGSDNDIKPLLERYYGSPNEEANADYANKIYECALCMSQNGNEVSIDCLKKARRECFPQ